MTNSALTPAAGWQAPPLTLSPESTTPVETTSPRTSQTLWLAAGVCLVLAIALAAQKTVENLFGGVAVISDRPVSIGDYCKFGDREGTVEDIGLRSTRVRTADRTLVTVPNGLFSGMTIENFERRDKMLFHITLNLRRDTTPDQVRAVEELAGRDFCRAAGLERRGTERLSRRGLVRVRFGVCRHPLLAPCGGLPAAIERCLEQRGFGNRAHPVAFE